MDLSLYSSMRRIFRCAVFFPVLVWFSINSQLMAQEGPNYIDDQDYVDVYVEPQNGNEQVTGENGQMQGGWEVIDQLNTGLLNYGYKEAVYHQFSGEDIFEDGNPLDGSFFFNYTWTRIKPLDFKIPPAWGYGAELLYFSSTS